MEGRYFFRAIDRRTGMVVFEAWDDAERFFRNRLWLSEEAGGVGIPVRDLCFISIDRLNTRIDVCQ